MALDRLCVCVYYPHTHIPVPSFIFTQEIKVFQHSGFVYNVGKISVVDLNKLNLDPDPGPDPRLYYQF